MCLSEKKNLPVDLNLISQYVQDEQIARDFTIYYDLFKNIKMIIRWTVSYLAFHQSK